MTGMNGQTHRVVMIVSVLAVAALVAAVAPTPPNSYAPKDRTWEVHDMGRPQPKVITGVIDGAPPSDAIVLFDGKDLSGWEAQRRDKKTKKITIVPAAWKIENGYMEAVKKSGSIFSKKQFGSCQLHVEWCLPAPSVGEGQHRGNSGVFLMGVYELQVLDSYQSTTYVDGQAGAIYGQSPPQVNACRKPGEWQTYDIVFHRPHFDESGTCTKPATITVLHNGVLVQDHHTIWGAVAHKKVAAYRKHGDKGPIGLQDHGHPVRFRNIWIRDIPD